MGHKFAFKANLRRSLSRLVKETDEKFGKKIGSCPKQKYNWTKWKVNVLKHIVKIQDKPTPLELTASKGIRDLKNMNVIVKQADKNLGLVPIRGDIYAAMVRENLRPPAFEKVGHFPHEELCTRLFNTIRYSKDIGPHLKSKWIKHAKESKDPCPFYVMPKIHKEKLGTRPVTAQHSYMLAPVSKELARVLQIPIDGICEIAKDSKTVVQRLEDFKCPKHCVLVTYDVVKLYPSMDIQDGISTIAKNCSYLKGSCWINLLSLIMYNNYVTENGNIYRQRVGTATGTHVAPQYANLYLYHKFKDILNDKEILFQDRFIDDGFLIVSTKEHATRILKRLNDSSNLELTHNISDHTAVYLDLTVHKGSRFKEKGILDLKVFFKPSNKMLYLPAKSSHPGHMKSGIVTGEAIRCLRNTSNKTDWIEAMRFIFKGLMSRGYRPSTIMKKWCKIRFEDRTKYIFETTPSKRPEGVIVMTSFHPDTYTHWKHVLAKFPLHAVFTYRRGALFSKAQLNIMKLWPPKIVWADFNKIGRHTISARQGWSYNLQGKKRKRSQEVDTTNSSKVRRIH